MLKKCCKCNVTKESTCFSKNKSTKDGFAKQCKECINSNSKYKQKQNTRSKKYYSLNKEKVKQYKNEYYLENKENLNKTSREYYKNNKVEMNKRNRDYYKINKNKINNWRKEYLKYNNNAKITHYLRSSLCRVLKSKNTKKSISVMNLISCSIEFFIEYIEQKFTKNMSWDNYGKYGWHLDHIKPCSMFNLENEEEQKKCFHYSNLQPLWATTEIAIKFGENSDYIGNLEKQNKFYNIN